LGAVTGQTIAFVQIPDDQMYNALKGAGDKFANTMIAMYSAMRDSGCELWDSFESSMLWPT
jgi:hypothetical protein